MSVPIKKAVITAAGMGSRFLPQTKSMPKEMLPLNNKPIIQHIVEGLVKAGVEQIVIVTGFHKRAVENHFDRNYEFETTLENAGKTVERKAIIDIAMAADFIYVRQKEGKGNAAPIMAARSVIGDEPFFVVFPDDFYITCEKPNEYEQMLASYNKFHCPIFSLFEVAEEDIDKYGIIKTKDTPPYRNRHIKIDGLVEKPPAYRAPSNLAAAGTYILNSDIWPFLDLKLKDSNGEHNLPVTIGRYAKEHQVMGTIIEGGYHDTGSPKLYIKAVIEMALEDKEIAPYIKKYLREIVLKDEFR